MADDGTLERDARDAKQATSWLLAIECATRSASVALLNEGLLTGERISRDRGNHAETLLGLVDDLLGDAPVSLDEIGGFAVSIGPGSFTSLRVGLATVKGLAFASDARVAPISTLAALAWEAAGGLRSDVAAALDARRGELYGAVFRCTGGAEVAIEPLVSEGLFSIEDFARVVPAGCLAVGSGAELCEAAFEIAREAGGAGVEIRSGVAPTARAVGQLGAALLARGGGVSAAELAPRYLRRAEAEALRLGSEVEGEA